MDTLLSAASAASMVGCEDGGGCGIIAEAGRGENQGEWKAPRAKETKNAERAPLLLTSLGGHHAPAGWSGSNENEPNRPEQVGHSGFRVPAQFLNDTTSHDVTLLPY